MPKAPPREYWDQLEITELVKAVTDGLTVIIQKQFLPYALEAVSDRLERYDFERLKEQLDRANGMMALMIRKRIDYRTWLTGPVAEGKNGGPTNTTTSNDNLGATQER